MVFRRVLWVALVASLALGAAACGDGDDGAGSGSGSGGHEHGDTKAQFDTVEATTVVDVQAVDYAFNGIPPTVKGPNVLFNVRNTGFAEHELVVMGADGEPVGELSPFKRNQSKSLAVKLAPGTYTAQCLVSEGAKNHVQLGMKTTFTVQ